MFKVENIDWLKKIKLVLKLLINQKVYICTRVAARITHNLLIYHKFFQIDPLTSYENITPYYNLNWMSKSRITPFKIPDFQ